MTPSFSVGFWGIRTFPVQDDSPTRWFAHTMICPHILWRNDIIYVIYKFLQQNSLVLSSNSDISLPARMSTEICWSACFPHWGKWIYYMYEQTTKLLKMKLSFGWIYTFFQLLHTSHSFSNCETLFINHVNYISKESFLVLMMCEQKVLIAGKSSRGRIILWAKPL